MRKSFIIINFTIFFTQILIAQTGEWSYIGGAKMSTTARTALFGLCGTDSESSLSSFQGTPKMVLTSHFNINYSNKIYKNLNWVAGAGYNTKAISRHGEPIIHHLVGASVGLRYDFLRKGIWYLGIESTFNPEMVVSSKNSGFNNLMYASVSTISLGVKISPYAYLVLNPFAETGFAKLKDIPDSPSYYPYSFGAMMGLKFRIPHKNTDG